MHYYQPVVVDIKGANALYFTLRNELSATRTAFNLKLESISSLGLPFICRTMMGTLILYMYWYWEWTDKYTLIQNIEVTAVPFICSQSTEYSVSQVETCNKWTLSALLFTAVKSCEWLPEGRVEYLLWKGWDGSAMISFNRDALWCFKAGDIWNKYLMFVFVSLLYCVKILLATLWCFICMAVLEILIKLMLHLFCTWSCWSFK